MSAPPPDQLDGELLSLVVARLGEADRHASWRSSGVSAMPAFGMSST